MPHSMYDHEVPKKDLNPTDIQVIDKNAYSVPYHEVTDEGLVEKGRCPFHFTRGSVNDPSVPRQAGFFTETVIAICIRHLQEVNQGELANRDTSIAITHLEDALMRLQKRAADRKARGVQGTYQK